MEVQVQVEDLTVVDDGDAGYDLLINSSEMGIPSGTPPPGEIQVIYDKNTRVFSLAVEVVNGEDDCLYWSYWDDDPEPVNLKVLNDQS